MAKKLISDIERFWQSVDGKENGCIEWEKYRTKDGYGVFSIGSRKNNSRTKVLAHRWIYEQVIGKIPTGMEIDHLCRNRGCVNPDHLDVVTHLDNMQRGWAHTKLYCKSGHPLFGKNLTFVRNRYRRCRLCSNAYTRKRYRETGGAAQKRYDSRNREKRRLASIERRKKIREGDNLGFR